MMNKSDRIGWCLAAVAAVLVVAWSLARRPVQPEPAPAPPVFQADPAFDQVGQASGFRVVDYLSPTNAAFTSTRTLRIAPDQLLAMVNGERIALGDLVPIDDAGKVKSQDLSEEAYTYLLDRAINRVLVRQEATRQGVKLSEGQRQQLARYQGERASGGPGLVRQLNLTPAALAFEQRDAEAFMLQTSLMAARGQSPNVRSAQVLEYYAAHAAEFRELPEEELARQAAWQEIDSQIRHQLAAQVRTSYGTELASFMNDLRAGASVQVFAQTP